MLFREIGRWQMAAHCLQEASLSALRLTTVSYNMLLKSCGGSNSSNTWQSVVELLRGAYLRGVECDAVSLNTATAAVKDSWSSVFVLLRTSLSQGIQQDAITVGSGTDACALTSCWDDALQLLHSARGRDIRIDVLGCSALAAACEVGGKWRQALAACWKSCDSGMLTDTVLAGAGITAHGSANLWEAAVNIMFTSMVVASLRVDVVCFGAASHACELGGSWHTSLRILQLMNMISTQSNKVVLGAAISSCRWASKWQWATHLHKTRFKPGQVLFNAHMGACASSAQWREALSSCLKAECQSVAPDNIALSTLATACGTGGQWELAMAVHRRRSDFAERELDGTSLGALVHAMSNSWQWPLAGLLLAEAGQGNLQPDAVSLEEVVGACARSGAFAVAADLLHCVRQLLRSPSTSIGVPLAWNYEVLRPLGNGYVAAPGLPEEDEEKEEANAASEAEPPKPPDQGTGSVTNANNPAEEEEEDEVEDFDEDFEDEASIQPQEFFGS
ncbi:MRL1 [Symbiodinium natans]|uniref:MRL1 protein n=1 Tax=Symbiodinium natans TaxID=878477 RepID=A0A812MMA7_9DINO|nr:MRL1 [Symbiodinium natans]